MKMVRGIGRNIDCVARTHDERLTTEGHFHLAVKKDEGLFEVVTMRPGTAACRDVHVDHAEPAVGVASIDRDGVGIADETDMGQRPLFQVGSFYVVRRHLRDRTS